MNKTHFSSCSECWLGSCGSPLTLSPPLPLWAPSLLPVSCLRLPLPMTTLRRMQLYPWAHFYSHLLKASLALSERHKPGFQNLSRTAFLMSDDMLICGRRSKKHGGGCSNFLLVYQYLKIFHSPPVHPWRHVTSLCCTSCELYMCFHCRFARQAFFKPP